MSVDDMLWWLFDQFKIVVGTRTVRRAFERKGDKIKPGKGKQGGRRKSGALDDDSEDDSLDDVTQTEDSVMSHVNEQYLSPFAPTATPTSNAQIENQLRQAMQQQTSGRPYPALLDVDGELPEDEETVQLQLQQIALQKREVELKLKLRRLQGTPALAKKSMHTTPQSAPSTLYNPIAATVPTPPKRDSRSKKKIEESKKRTAERQERMLRDLERRSRRREHLTAEWVHSKDIWPLRAQSLLADLMHQYACYTYTQQNEDTFSRMFSELYQLVDQMKGDWDPNIHDDMLRERMKRKMGQLRNKMQKTGEIIGRSDGYGGFQKAENYTGETAGATVGDENELIHDPALQADEMQAQSGAVDLQHHEQLQYDPVPDQQMQHHNMYPTPIMHHHQGPASYPMPGPQYDSLLTPYMSAQQGMTHQDGMTM